MGLRDNYPPALALGINAPNITACLKGRQKTSGKYHWEYVEE